MRSCTSFYAKLTNLTKTCRLLKSHASKKAHEIRKRLKKTGPSRKVKHSPKTRRTRTDLEFSFLEPRTTGSHHVVPRDPHVQTLISRSYPTLKAKTYTRLLFQGLSNMLLTETASVYYASTPLTMPTSIWSRLVDKIGHRENSSLILSFV